MFRKHLVAAALLWISPAAFAQECTIVLEGNDAMQYSLKNIDVGRSCKEFTINLKHVGKLARNVMGHNVVIAKTTAVKGIEADGIKAGLASEYVKAGDSRVVAHSKVIGGGESTSLTFPVAELSGTEPYSFFCSFPGHSTLMKGTITLTS